MPEIAIVPAALDHINSYHDCIESVARERVHIGRLHAPSESEMVRRFETDRENGIIQDLALVDERVVGWAVAVPNSFPSLRHSAGLGLGMHRDFRRQGIGLRLMEGVIEKAWERGLERLELEAWADNLAAISLYEKLGFQHEGVLRNYRFLDGEYTDAVMMGLLRE